MNYRILDPSEWDKLDALVEAVYRPTPDSATAAVCEDDNGNLVGVLFLQLAMHMEPLILTSPSVNFARLHDVLYNAVSKHKGLRIYAFSDKSVVDGMAVHVGMKQLPYKIFEQEVV